MDAEKNATTPGITDTPVAPPTKQVTWQDILLQENYLTEDALEKIDQEAKETDADPLDVMFSLGFMTKSLFGQAIAEYYTIPFADLITHAPPKEDVLKIPEDEARRLRRVVYKDGDEQVVVATDRPMIPVDDGFRALFPGKAVQLAYALPEDVDAVFSNYRKTLDTRFASIISERGRVAQEIFNEIMNDAVTFRSSDIHFEPRIKDVLIRFRIDGLLHEAGRLPRDLYENVLNRIKVMAHLRTDEHFGAQDGAIHYQLKDQMVDIRVSIVPIVDGEKVVMRLLYEYMRRFQLSDLGLSQRFQNQLVESANKPFGMILVVGPTGSGKTTSLYAAVKHLNRLDVNISTIEDPVEYKIAGVNHIQVNPQTNLTFAHGLRSIVRQDPDIILVGEIRDQETVDVALNAALTGHMLLSTFHANDAVSAVPRLLDMGAEPFLLSSSVELIIAQRLARRICASCRYSVVASREDIARDYPQVLPHMIGPSFTLYQGKGCSVCSMTGYKGRIGLFEVIQATAELRDLIMHRPSAKDIATAAIKSGMRPMFFDGLEKVSNGVISLGELLRVAAPPEAYE